jgi:hypothetical protein
VPGQLGERRHELLDRGEGKLHLSLDTGDADSPKVLGGLGRVSQESRLADACFAVEDQRGAPLHPRAGKQQVECLALTLPTEQPTRRQGGR